MWDFLPTDLVIGILTILPIKTLVRCTCVCKSWYSVITNPNFITSHLHRSNSDINNNSLLVRRYTDSAVHFSLLHYKNGIFCDNEELELPLKSGGDLCLRIVGSCNGLVCLSEDLTAYMEELYLWNPSIRKTVTLPPLRIKFCSHGDYVHAIGFGIDSVTDDYKVVRIVYLHDYNIESPPEVDIFSLSTGTWRNISNLGLLHRICKRAPQAYVNGAAHWLAYNKSFDFFNLIVSFHMGDEVFGEIMVPPSISRSAGSDVCVAKFKESLSLIDGAWGETCSIWVMKEYGISDSWTKLWNIDTSVGFECVFGFTRKGEVLLGLNSELVAYDPYAKRAMHLNIRGSISRWLMGMFYADAYTESLVLFGAKFGDTATTGGESPFLNKAHKSRKRAKLAPHLYRKPFGIFCLYRSKERRAKPSKKGKKRQDG